MDFKDGENSEISLKQNDNVIYTILDLMVTLQKTNLRGTQKKDMVMQLLRETLSPESFVRYEPIFGMTIDILKFIAHDPTMIHGLKTIKKCFLKNVICFNK